MQRGRGTEGVDEVRGCGLGWRSERLMRRAISGLSLAGLGKGRVDARRQSRGGSAKRAYDS
jgi:hypothetical protein